jgi:hypothetical protein
MTTTVRAGRSVGYTGLGKSRFSPSDRVYIAGPRLGMVGREMCCSAARRSGFI